VRVTRIVVIASLALMVLALPQAGYADHCGGIATVEPASGPPGTTFIFRTNQGGPTNVYLYHDGTLVRTDTLEGDGSVTYRIHTEAGDEGPWRVRAAVQGQEGCAGTARFRVTSLPDTASPPIGPGGWTEAVALLAGAISLAWTLRRPRARHSLT